MTEDRRRAFAFADRLLRRLSTEVVPLAWGTAYLDTEFPLRWDSNLLWVRSAGAPSLDELLGTAERVLGGAGLAHRRCVIEDPVLAAQLGVGLMELGWRAEHAVLMVLRGQPDRPRDTGLASRLPYEQVRPLLEEITRRSPWASGEDEIQMLTDHRGKLERRGGATFYAARLDGQLAGCCELYVDGEDAQIESVGTLEEHRNRGVGSAVVLAAAAAARDAGATWIHLYADADDWPQAWYHRLGFEDAGSVRSFTRMPAGASTAGA